VVDGGDDVEQIVELLQQRGLRATQLVHTHAHFDHIGALADLHDRTGGRGWLHPGDLPLYAALNEQARWVGLPPTELRTIPIDAELRDGDVVRVGDIALTVLHTPGHTPGSTSFAFDVGGATRILSGDTLFRGGVGRWDLGGTSLEDIVYSIRDKIFAYADDAIVIPGHGPATTVGVERSTNPYLVG
jgi:glyoxylase-like metal-dependent hydrolase (beta-lactamase superfamily II)